MAPPPALANIFRAILATTAVTEGDDFSGTPLTEEEIAQILGGPPPFDPDGDDEKQSDNDKPPDDAPERSPPSEKSPHGQGETSPGQTTPNGQARHHPLAWCSQVGCTSPAATLVGGKAFCVAHARLFRDPFGAREEVAGC